jgi:hypothetical protein
MPPPRCKTCKDSHWYPFCNGYWLSPEECKKYEVHSWYKFLEKLGFIKLKEIAK